ncbi:anthrax toxin lethal factor-related metalloendopeptidase [Salinicoccus albus]|uniref:anthrax toxin lethal factor-related metalloendopeptidase n=1 Tax=Salinicoccus albus TaxID=418756 RepID=UPI0003746C3F|nr:hypothetical protein [Salinicoccus albus]
MTIKTIGKFSFAAFFMIITFLMVFNTDDVSANTASLDRMIEIRDNDNSYDQQEAQAMINRLDNIDDRILNHTDRAGVQIVLMDMPLTQLQEFEHLAGVTPRGWENTGRTWEDVPGAGGYTTAARIGYSEPGNGHSTINLELHEFAHAVDSYAAGFTVSDSAYFQELMASEKNALFSDHNVPEYFDTPSEYFAEVFAMYYLGGEQRQKLADRAPETYHFISTFHNRLVTIDNVTGNTAEFSWDGLENAEQYEIYRNDERIDTTTKTSYEDEDLDSSTNYDYYVRALDSNGDPLLTTYFRSMTTQATDDAQDTELEPLETAISEAENLSEAERSPETEQALDNANEVLNNEESSQEEVDEAAEALQSAVENNDEEANVAENQTEESSGEETTEEVTEESTEEAATEEPTEESTEEETTEEPTAEETEQSAESVDTDEESQQADSGLNMVMIFAGVILLILAIVSGFIIWSRRK